MYYSDVITSYQEFVTVRVCFYTSEVGNSSECAKLSSKEVG